MTRKTQIGIVLAGLFFALVGFTIAYRLKMTDGAHETLQAPADPTPVVSLYEDGTLAKAEAAFQAELEKPLDTIPKDDPVVTALLKEYPKPELGAIAPPMDTAKAIEARPTSFTSPDAKPTELPALPIPSSPLPADLRDPRVNLGLPQTADLAPPAPSGSPAAPEFAVVRHDPPLVSPAEETSHPKLSPQTDPPPLHGTTTPTEPPGFPGVVTPPSATPAPVPNVTPQAPPTPSVTTAPAKARHWTPSLVPSARNQNAALAPQPRCQALPCTGTVIIQRPDATHFVLTESVWEQLDKSRDLFVTPGPEQCLMLTSGAGLERLATRLDVENGGDGKTRRLLFARSERLRVDANGHTVLPERLAFLAALGDEICVVGVGDHFEIWDAARWQRYSGGDSPVKEIRQTSATQLSMPVSK